MDLGMGRNMGVSKKSCSMAIPWRIFWWYFVDRMLTCTSMNFLHDTLCSSFCRYRKKMSQRQGIMTRCWIKWRIHVLCVSGRASRPGLRIRILRTSKHISRSKIFYANRVWRDYYTRNGAFGNDRLLCEGLMSMPFRFWRRVFHFVWFFLQPEIWCSGGPLRSIANIRNITQIDLSGGD